MTALNGAGPERLTLDALPTVDLRSTRQTMARSVTTLVPHLTHLTMPSLHPAEPFFADQILSMSVRLPVEPLRNPDAFHGWLARQVGETLKVRCKLHAPMALDFTDVDHQIRQLQQSGKTDGLSCFLKTDDRNRHLCLAFWRDGMQMAESPLLKLSRIPHGEVLVQLMDLEPEVEQSIDTLAVHRSGLQALRLGRVTLPAHLRDKVSEEKPLANLPKWQRVSVSGHGGAMPEHLGGMPGVADAVGNLTPRELCKRLKSMGLPTDHRGELTLFACNAGTSVDGRPSYLERLREELAKSGYRHLSLSGAPAITSASRHIANTAFTAQLPPQEWDYLPRTLSDSERRQTQLVQRIQGYHATLAAKDDEGAPVLTGDERQRTSEDLTMALRSLQKEKHYHDRLVADVAPLRNAAEPEGLDRQTQGLSDALGLARYRDLSVRMGPKPR